MRCFFPGQPGNKVRLPAYYDYIAGGEGLCNPGGSGPLAYYSPFNPFNPYPACSSAPIRLNQVSGILTPANTSLFQGAGFFAQQFTVPAVAGQEVSFWAAANFDTFITVARSSLAIVAQDHNSGYIDRFAFASATSPAVPITDNYIFEVSTFNAGQGGSFVAAWSSGRTASITPTLGAFRNQTYVPGTNRIWIAEVTNIDIVNPVTNTVVDSFVPSAAPIDILTCQATGQIFIALSNSTIEVRASDKSLVKVITMGAGGTNLKCLSEDPNQAKMWWACDSAGPGTTPVAQRVNTLTLAIDSTLTHNSSGIPGATHEGTVDQARSNYFLAVDDHTMFKIAPDGVTVTGPLPGISVGNFLKYVPAADRIYTQLNTVPATWGVLNPVTSNMDFTSTNAGGPTLASVGYSSCNGMVYLSFDNFGVALIPAVTKSNPTVSHFLRYAGSTYQSFLFVPFNSGMYSLFTVDGTVRKYESV